MCCLWATALLAATAGPLAAATQQPARPETPTREPSPEPVPEPSENPAAEPTGPDQAQADPAGPGADRVLGPAEMLDLFGLVRSWVDRGGAPETPDAQIPPAWVVAVTIREGENTEGRIIGEETLAAGNEREAATAIQRAAQRAIRRAVARLQGEPDALRAQRVRDGLANTRLSLEVATQRPIPAAGGVGVDSIDEWIRPGIEGLVVSRGDDLRAHTPGQMLASAQPASAAVVAMVAELADSPTVALEPFDALADRGFGLSLFRVTHAAQATAGGPPLLLHRGGIVARPIGTQAEVAAMADRLARHLMKRSWAGVERFGLRGDLDPVHSRFTPSVAPPFAQAFAAEALARYARAPGVNAETAARAMSSAETILSALAVVEQSERAPWGDAVSASACLSALVLLDRLTVDRSDELRGLRERCLRAIGGAYTEAAGFDPGVPVAARGVVARGLLAAVSFEPWEREAHLIRADLAIRAAFRDAEQGRLLTLMPDLGWADMELAELLGGPPKSASALRALRERVLENQIKQGDMVEADRDLVGGFVLDAGGSPLPTWQGLRPTGLLASMLGDPALTRGTLAGGEAGGQIIRLTEALRFLRQLMAEERLGHMYADPDLALGGVRASLWDQTMPLTGSALGLVTLAETLESLDEVASRPPQAAGGP